MKSTAKVCACPQGRNCLFEKRDEKNVRVNLEGWCGLQTTAAAVWSMENLYIIPICIRELAYAIGLTFGWGWEKNNNKKSLIIWGCHITIKKLQAWCTLSKILEKKKKKNRYFEHTSWKKFNLNNTFLK